ncbi:hypothetical protein K2P97_03680 [bacterium]|nr:hypothetical protein [bacterium]
MGIFKNFSYIIVIQFIFEAAHSQIFIPNSFWQDLTPCKASYCPTPSPTVATLQGIAGMTQIISTSADDANIGVTLPFNFAINSISSRSWFVGSNTFITRDTGSNVCGPPCSQPVISGSNPALNKFMLGANDNSYQRVYFISGTNYFRIRYEGTAATSGTPGSPNIVYEFTFYRPDGFGNQYAVVVFGTHNRATGAFGVANTASYYVDNTSTTPGANVAAGPGPGITANTSYLFSSNNGGISWTLQQGWSITGTGTNL